MALRDRESTLYGISDPKLVPNFFFQRKQEKKKLKSTKYSQFIHFSSWFVWLPAFKFSDLILLMILSCWFLNHSQLKCWASYRIVAYFQGFWTSFHTPFNEIVLNLNSFLNFIKTNVFLFSWKIDLFGCFMWLFFLFNLFN